MWYVKPSPVVRAKCTSTPCKHCHGDILERTAPTGSPKFSKSTGSSNRRAISSIPSRIQGNKSEFARQQSKNKHEQTSKKTWFVRGFSFLRLPFELRAKIYAFCLTLEVNRLLRGWVEGGGFHPDHERRFWDNIHLFSNAKFPVELLLICKTISIEAKEEIYRLIHFQVNVPSPFYLSHLFYWLRKHPVRFTTNLEIPFGLFLSTKPSRPKQLNSNQIVLLAKTIKTMPNLRILDLRLVIYNSCATRSLSTIVLQRIFRHLLLLRETIIDKVQQLCIKLVTSNVPEQKRNAITTFLNEHGFHLDDRTPELPQSIAWEI
jgi:hypothetical protein